MNIIKSKGGYFYKVYKNGKKVRISKNEYLKSKKIPSKKMPSKKIMKGGRVLPITINVENGQKRNDLVVLDTGYEFFSYSNEPDVLRLEILGNNGGSKQILELEFVDPELGVRKVQKIKELASKNTSKRMQTREAFAKPWVKEVLEKAGSELYRLHSQDLLNNNINNVNNNNNNVNNKQIKPIKLSIENKCIEFNENFEVINSSRYDFMDGLRLIKIGNKLVNNTLQINRLFNNASKYPLELHFESPLNLPSELFWKENSEVITKVPEKKNVLNKALEITKNCLHNDEIVMYSSKLMWEVILGYISGDKTGCIHSEIPSNSSPKAILNIEENTNVPMTAFIKSVSFSLRCNVKGESVLGIYLTNSRTAVSRGKYKHWFIANPNTNIKLKKKFDDLMSKYEKIMHSRVVTIYKFKDGFSDNHLKLSGNFGNTEWPQTLTIPGNNLEEKVMFLNKSQSITCKEKKSNYAWAIQGRLVLDRNKIICQHLFTDTQSKFINSFLSKISNNNNNVNNNLKN